VSTVDLVSLKEFVVAEELDDDRDKLVDTLFEKMESVLGDKLKLES